MARDSFKDFVLDQLGALEVDCRAMFGGYGLYADDRFFGIIHRSRLYFKTDPSTRARYAALGMKSFRASAKQTLRNYYEVPADVIDNPENLSTWARDALTLAAAPTTRVKNGKKKKRTAATGRRRTQRTRRRPL